MGRIDGVAPLHRGGLVEGDVTQHGMVVVRAHLPPRGTQVAGVPDVSSPYPRTDGQTVVLV